MGQALLGVPRDDGKLSQPLVPSGKIGLDQWSGQTSSATGADRSAGSSFRASFTRRLTGEERATLAGPASAVCSESQAHAPERAAASGQRDRYRLSLAMCLSLRGEPEPVARTLRATGSFLESSAS